MLHRQSSTHLASFPEQRLQPTPRAHSTPPVQKAPSTRMWAQIDPLVAEELSGNVLNVDYPTFLEHALGCHPGLAMEWRTFLSELSRRPEIEGYLDELSTAKNETDRHTPFAEMANFILDKAQEQFPLPDTGLLDLRFAHNNNPCDHCSGPPEAGTAPSRKPDVVLVRKRTADFLAMSNQQPSILWAEILCAIEFISKPERSGNSDTAHQDAIASSISAGPSNGLKRKVSKDVSRDAPPTQKLWSQSRSGSIHTGGSGVRDEDEDEDFKHLSSYPLEIFSSTGGTREHALSMTVDGNDLQLWYYDRAGAIYCDPRINIRTDFVQFSATILACSRLSLPQFGGLSCVDFPSSHDIPTSLEHATLTLQDSDGLDHTVTLTGEVISSRPGIVGRCSFVCGAVCPSIAHDSDSVVKFSFQDVTRTSEVDIIRHARELDVSFLPGVHLWQDFPRLSQGLRGRLVPEENGSFKYEDRVLRVLVLDRYTPVYKLPTLSDFQDVIRDVFECMNQLRVRAQVLHRDISYTNIMAKRLPDGSFRGVLNDFDLAVRLDQLPAAGQLSLHRTGTLPFMAVTLLNHQPTPHKFRHDVESLFYVLVWIAVQFDANGRYVCHEELESWQRGSVRNTRAAKVDFISQADTLNFLQLTDFYSPLKTTWLEPLKNVIFLLHVESSLRSRNLALDIPPFPDHELFAKISTILLT